jgi:hypothetical protein
METKRQGLAGWHRNQPITTEFKSHKHKYLFLSQEDQGFFGFHYDVFQTTTEQIVCFVRKLSM